ncbi:hypothetical protein O6H91_10G065400 [Diphasiastrum complanatum]|uniref:Uncharacterized protein n=2 Tax=Diphasiastrum complanatum TaxID=34168 RepID=A0ACC2CHY1_DIPCM|nr:hypothetical protein O6H91_10G065400 [Diphasiastrum complanatum]KAJ7541571.1 hypothetical protein O6H91_10G065400 [Diphasiastrum complanatum]
MPALCCISPVSYDREHPSLSVKRNTKMPITFQPHNSSRASKTSISAQGKTLSGAQSPLVCGLSVASSRHSVADVDSDVDGYRTPMSSDTQPRNSAFSGELYNIEDMAANCNSSSYVAGILYKWVHFGKGWKPRWFILHEGVLSYYKLHGPDKIHFNYEHHTSLRVVGEEAHRLLKKHSTRSGNKDEKRSRKAFAGAHLKVSSLRQSKSDDRKFYVYTATKTLHLRAESKEDRITWLDVLRTLTHLCTRNTVFVNCFPPAEEITISTERLKGRLIKEGLSDSAIKDCEQIIQSELSELQGKLMMLQQKRISLDDKVQKLEADKLELESKVVDELHQQADAASQPGNSTSNTGSEDDEDIHQVVNLESDEDEDVFFDTRESLVGGILHSLVPAYSENSANFGGATLGAEHAFCDLAMSDAQPGYPHVKRRKKLPDPKEKERGVSLWSMIKDNIGKDLTKVCLPVYFNEPISSLQKCFEDLEYSYLLDQAWEWGNKGNSLMRILYVAAFAVSGYASSDGRSCKPFNPLLGETYEADYPDKGVRFVSEKVSHHPMIVACHCKGRGWKFWGDSNLKSKFWGRSIQLDPVGVLTLEFDDGEVFRWSKVTTSIYNLILGKLYCDHYGTMRIQGNRELACKLKFKEQSIIDRNPHQVQGFVYKKSGQTLASLMGKWDESMYYRVGDPMMKQRGTDPMLDAHLLWKRYEASDFPTRYNLTSFAIAMNELTPGLKEKLPPTDSRLRPDQRHLENGEYEQANSEKLRLEQKQRKARQLQETGWQPRWFRKDKGQDTFQYIGGYWEAREKTQWLNCPNIFGTELPDALSG